MLGQGHTRDSDGRVLGGYHGNAFYTYFGFGRLGKTHQSAPGVARFWRRRNSKRSGFRAEWERSSTVVVVIY